MTSPAELSNVDRAMLAVAGGTWTDGSARDQHIRDRFHIGVVAFWQRVNRLLDSQAALAADPVTVNRLRRIRAARRARSHVGTSR